MIKVQHNDWIVLVLVRGYGKGYQFRLNERDLREGTKQAVFFSLLHVVQTGSGVHPTSYSMGTGGRAAGA
jgi:hypothetical protein